MRKLKFFIAAVLACFLAASAGGATLPAAAAEKEYYLGGMTAGFSLSAGGAQVVGLVDVVTESGAQRPAADAGIRAGDVICEAGPLKIRSVNDLNASLNKSAGREVTLSVRRGGETARVQVTPVREKKSGDYKIGVLIRDSVSGIGTVTYVETDSLRFGALGHAVTDENKDELSVSDPRVYLCSIIGVNKGERGKAGELRGLFLNDKTVGKAEKVCKTGLYGTFERSADLTARRTVQAGGIEEATIGKAEIYATVDGVTPQKYEIAIAKVDAGNRENKNFVIKITDEKLIGETGGIVQGMSGSPILQNGKLIGAVTHVFLNDPTRGYGIAIEHMLGEE